MSVWQTDEPHRLDAFLAQQLPDVSRSRLQKAVEEGFVTVDGSVQRKPGTKLKAAQSVVLQSGWDSRENDGSIEPVDLQLTLLYEDDDCFVLDKPAGYAVHPGSGLQPGEVTLLHGIAYLFAERSLPFSPEAVLVHRLDKDTTGCILVAKTPAAHAALQQQFEQRTVDKQYLAVVAGVPQPAQALIDAPIGRHTTDRTKMSVLHAGKTRAAKTAYRTLDAVTDCALLLCDLYTGRTHQVRVHLASIGHPILGDATYETPESSACSAKYQAATVCLHAWKLAFTAPAGEPVQVEAPLPAALQAVLTEASLRFSDQG